MKCKFWSPQVMDYYLAISYQLPDLAHYRYCYLLMLFNAYIILLWLVHVYETQTIMVHVYEMTIIGLVSRKCIKHMQLIIRLVHFIIIGVSTCNCMIMYTHKMGIWKQHVTMVSTWLLCMKDMITSCIGHGDYIPNVRFACYRCYYTWRFAPLAQLPITIIA